MKESTMKMMLIVTIVLAVLCIIICTVSNSDYARLANNIKYMAEQQKESTNYEENE